MDIGDTIAPTSDQLDAVDLLAGERTFTIAKVSKGDAEQPVNIHLAEFPRPWRPGKSMRRVLVACWGTDAAVYVGRRVTLFCDPSVKFGGEQVGGIRIRALSHLDQARVIPLLVTRGRSAAFRVQPLREEPARELTPLERLRAEWKSADPERQKAIEAEVAALQAGSAAAAPVEELAPVDLGSAPVVEDPPDYDPTTDPSFGTEDAR